MQKGEIGATSRVDEDEENYYIVFDVAECTTDEIRKFLKFLEDHKQLSFEPVSEEVNGNVFAKINFKKNFITHSDYVEQLKFQLPVKKKESNCVASKEKSSEIGTVSGNHVGANQKLNKFERALRSIKWFINFICKEEEILSKDLKTFELRRNNTEWFEENDLKSFLIRGTILRSILNDQFEYDIEHFLYSVRSETSREQLLAKIDNKEFISVRRYLEETFRNKIEETQNKQEIVENEIFIYKNYNTVRNKITILPLHKKSNCDDPLEKWVALRNSLGLQPLCEIKNYFGVKIATYFAWAGFYTYMLIIASILGLLCMLFGLTVVPYSKLSREICNSDVIMCPRCDKWCDYWKLKDTCTYSKLHHSIDNTATFIYTIFMSLWSALYLQQWKRYIARYNTKWNVINLDHSSEFSRRKYVKNVHRLMENQYFSTYLTPTETHPYVKVSKIVKTCTTALSFSICVLWVSLSLCMVFAVLLYRMSLITSERLYGDRNSYSIYLVPISTAILNLFGIQILNCIYDKIAKYFTELELPRTETEYENSLSIKLFLFHFVNYYAGIFYIAIFKGKFTGTPAHYTRIFGLRQEECNPGGCLVELAIQLGIIMTGRQAIKLATPHLLSLITNIKDLYFDRSDQSSNNIQSKSLDYVKNYNLKENDFTSLVPEYSEMVIQFGFVTLFVAAFPLAPLFALLNNILEVRLDGRKFLKEYRRALPSRVKDIGVWLKIMSILVRLAAVSNAVIIAFSSHLIPKWVYRMNYSSNHTTAGYLEHSLALFHTKDFEAQSEPLNSEYFNISACYYLQYRSSPEDDNKYSKHVVYWHVMAMRLGFIVLYQLGITLCVLAVEYAVPSIPRRVKTQLRRNTRFMLQFESEMNFLLRGGSNKPADVLNEVKTLGSGSKS